MRDASERQPVPRNFAAEDAAVFRPALPSRGERESGDDGHAVATPREMLRQCRGMRSEAGWLWSIVQRQYPQRGRRAQMGFDTSTRWLFRKKLFVLISASTTAA